jgi:hypothetical protein
MRQRVARYHASRIPSNRENRLRVIGDKRAKYGRWEEKNGNPGACQYRIWSRRSGGEHFIPQLQHCRDAILKGLYFNAHEFSRFVLR